MDRRTLLAIAICFLVFSAWQKLYIEPRMPKPGQQQTQTAVQPPKTGTAQGTPAIVTPAAPRQPEVPIETRTLQTGIGSVKVTSGAKFFQAWDLKAYRLSLAPETAAVDMRSVTRQEAEGDLAFDSPEFAYLSQVRGTFVEVPGGVVWSFEDEKVKLTREFKSYPDQPYLDVRLTAEFKTSRPNFAFVSLNTERLRDDPEAQDRQILYFSNQSIERLVVDDSVSLTDVPAPVKWIGTANRYFVLSLVDQGQVLTKGLVQPVSPEAARVSMVYPLQGNQISIPLRGYFGPKDLNLLRAVEPTLDHAVDLGWFTIVAYPLLQGMKWLYNFVHNYGIAIIILTLLIKLATYPLTLKSMKSMKEMAKLQPQLQKLRDKYKDDREALNREMLTLMRGHGYNPMAGCLPILIQMPVFIALYRVLYSSVELYQAPFFFWIQDLSARDPFYVTPVLLTVTMFIQQKLTPNTATDPMQAKMLQFMPIIFGAFMLTLPSGLTLYMLVNALAGIVQQIVLNKKLGTGNVPTAVARAR